MAGAIRQAAGNDLGGEDVRTTSEDLFVGDVVTGVPSLESQLAPKMPGDADGNDQGDHCS